MFLLFGKEVHRIEKKSDIVKEKLIHSRCRFHKASCSKLVNQSLKIHQLIIFWFCMEIKSLFHILYYYYIPHTMTPSHPAAILDKLLDNERYPMTKPPVLKSTHQQQVDVLRNLISNYINTQQHMKWKKWDFQFLQ